MMSKPSSQFHWTGEESRPLQVSRPCSCGCDTRQGKLGVGYLTGSDSAGHGFTLWIETEAVYQAIQKALVQEAKAKIA